MFTWLNKQGVQSDRGFAVQFTARSAAEYREADKVVTLAVESGLTGGAPCIIVDPKAFDRWDSGELIPPHERARLFQNLKEAMEFQGLQLTIEAAESPR